MKIRNYMTVAIAVGTGWAGASPSQTRRRASRMVANRSIEAVALSPGMSAFHPKWPSASACFRPILAISLRPIADIRPFAEAGPLALECVPSYFGILSGM